MDANYLVLCGMVWAQFGQEDAGRELIRALASSDEMMRVLARTLLERADGGSKELIGQALAEEEISVSMASLCGFEQGQSSKPRMGQQHAVPGGFGVSSGAFEA
ncbi:MAG TPA: hypothetical protein VN777_16395 [Terriglobales bacterium]|nr:hypothetical protein [Terriglobales bacterium]